ncbi:M48 family metallopeptidase [Caenimonas aquaedulcis]|uniref:M48 family metallopeptidase n=1 Tax=Caenimonas aquaedulcis TaxID=2793270 RepID=A0A931MIE8_9BURK|nr:M48 family metallopeptidase [Caenimonas aquaedulcis]MBG9389180.1 M48 family metallopeptidase [Caenimonas aquaedulcis]
MQSAMKRYARTAVVAAALGLSALGAAAKEPPHEGVEVGKSSRLAGLVPAAQVEQAADQQYHQLLQQAQAKNALAPATSPQYKRLEAISQRLIPQSYAWNERAKTWKWEVNVVGSQQVNAFCMPGGKIAVFTGIMDKLQLSDDELAMVVGHEMAHALREHARARMSKGALTQGGMRIGGAVLSGIFGIDPHITDMAARGAASLLTLKFSRSDESEADLVGMELAARAGYDPRAAITLWKKMAQASQGQPPQWMSTHPSSTTRIAELERNIPRVMPLYQRTVAKR